MNHRLAEIRLRRGRLLERIATQRVVLSREVQPVQALLFSVDRVLARAQSVTDYFKQHPSLVAIGVGALFVMRSRRLWRWAKGGFFAWRTWLALRDGLFNFGSRNAARNQIRH